MFFKHIWKDIVLLLFCFLISKPLVELAYKFSHSEELIGVVVDPGINSISIELEDKIIFFTTKDKNFWVVDSGDKIRIRVFKYSPLKLFKVGQYYDAVLLTKYKP